MFFSLVMKSIPIQGSPFSCSNWKGAMGPVKAPPEVTDEHIVKSEGRLSVSVAVPDSVAKSVTTLSGPKTCEFMPLSMAGIATAMEARGSS